MLDDVSFEDHSHILDNFVSALYIDPADLKQARKDQSKADDIEENRNRRFFWIKAAHEKRVSEGQKGFDAVIRVIEFIEWHEGLRDLFAEMAFQVVQKEKEKKMFDSYAVLERMTDVGRDLLMHIEENGECSESVDIFVMQIY